MPPFLCLATPLPPRMRSLFPVELKAPVGFYCCAAALNVLPAQQTIISDVMNLAAQSPLAMFTSAPPSTNYNPIFEFNSIFSLLLGGNALMFWDIYAA
jgi:hypothetical protein